jgi:hypothetical protein
MNTWSNAGRPPFKPSERHRPRKIGPERLEINRVQPLDALRR